MSKSNLNPAAVIRGRLNLQTTQRELSDKFGISIPSLVLRPGFFNVIQKWDWEKRKSFYKVIAGNVNFNDTEEFLSSIK